MAKKEIIWSELAKIQFSNVLEFYFNRNESPDYSLRILAGVEDLLETLSENEGIGRLTSNKITRVIPMNVYLVFYEINKDRIEILSFWDNRQNIDNRKIK